MGVFNLSTLDNSGSKALFADALAMSIYSYHNIDNGLAWGYQHHGYGIGLPKTLLTALFGSSQSQGIVGGIPWNPDSEAQALAQVNQAGWSVISAEALGYTGKTDSRGTFYGEKSGYSTAQAEVLGKYDDAGSLVQIGIAFRGTSGPRESLISDTIGDIINDVKSGFLSAEYAENYATEAFGQLLSDVAIFAAQKGLNGGDVVFSGHSLGGLAVNSVAAQSEKLSEGFYSQSNYVAFASPTQYEVGDKVLNVGFENDPVFRSLDGTDFTLSTLLVHDKEHVSTTDNIVNFNDYYVSPLWNVLPQSILNISAWISHMQFSYQGGMTRILESDFYSLTERDSTVIVSTLSNVTRGSTWVEDLNKYAEKHTGPTFIIGSDSDDLIKGGSGNDYLEGRKGNDTFRDDGGYNIILGGEGSNTLDLQGKLSHHEIAYDGETLYLRNNAGEMTLAKDIRTISSSESFLLVFNKSVQHQVTDDGLQTGSALTQYAASVRGDDQNNNLYGEKGSWLFGLDGDDVLRGAGQNVFVGGEGDDLLIGAGHDNTYLFSGNFGNDTIYNFGKTDTLLFMGVEGATTGDYHDAAFEQNGDLVINFGINSVTLVGVNMDMLSDTQVVLA